MEIRSMKLEELEEVLDLAVAAFNNAALYRYIEPGEAERAAFLRAFFRQRFVNGFGYNQIDLAVEEGKIIGAAVWQPPEPAGFQREIRLSAQEAMREIAPETLRRLGIFFAAMQAGHERNPPPPVWVLTPIFIDPAFQGRGVGSRLIKKQLPLMDQSGIPCTLYAQEPVNVEIYRRYGFRVTGEDRVGDSGVVSYAMARPVGG
ncbi:MAG: GNAT family N-acetyltransferase [Christensenellaceae bacterium]|jgi:GNAT superfamily N-acetyltransferase|nr:GNAT family N-acetyltransferase [Christensenellaceae bacterium]